MSKNILQKKSSFLILTLAILYLIAGKASIYFLDGDHIVTIGIFASEGIALAFILFFGKRILLGIFIGQFILAYSNDITPLASFAIAIINSLEALIGYKLVHKFKLDINLNTFKDVFGLIGIILFIQLFSASLSNAVLVLNEFISQKSYFESSFSWWFGNVMGQLLVTPFLLLLFLNYKEINIRDYLSSIFLFGLFIYFLEVTLGITNLLLLLSFSIPVIVLIVSYRGFTYGVAFSVILSLVSLYSVYFGVGAFYLQGTFANVVNYNLFVLAHISTVFFTGVLFEERKKNLLLLENTVINEVNKNKEQQLLLLQQSRLAQMGEMIAMIAHQWRQPLNNLSLANQLLIAKYKKGKLNDTVVNTFKENSKKQINHMSKTIDDFRNFFKSEQISKDFCVNDVVKHILSITQNIYNNYDIKLNLIEKGQFYSNGYPNELGQAILNIINNSKDALLEMKKREKYINIYLLKREDIVTILIEDNAGGIPDTIKEKIFDPYFSTKQNKNGTGLGLYMSKMIVIEKLNGKINFYNTKEGVTFEIQFKEIGTVS